MHCLQIAICWFTRGEKLVRSRTMRTLLPCLKFPHPSSRGQLGSFLFLNPNWNFFLCCFVHALLLVWQHPWKQRSMGTQLPAQKNWLLLTIESLYAFCNWKLYCMAYENKGLTIFKTNVFQLLCLQHDGVSFELQSHGAFFFFFWLNNILPHPKTFSDSHLCAFHFKFSFPLIARAHQKTWHSPLSIRTPDKSNHSRTNRQKIKDFLHYTLDFPI